MNYRVTVVWDKGASVRPNANAGGNPLDTFVKNTVFEIDGMFPDTTDPTNPKKLWGRITNHPTLSGKYVALLYPASSSSAYIRCEWQEISTTPPPDDVVVRTHVIEVFSDGSITIDGNPVV